MIQRHLAPTMKERSGQYPIVTLTGPRQSGKTTLCRQCFPEKPYSNLERPDTRAFAQSDPRGYLEQFPEGAVLDEIQRVPELLSWLQVRVDLHNRKGEFILTGSHHFELSRSVSQSLAGRTALLELLPLSIAELQGAGADTSINRMLYAGGYPRIHADRLDPTVLLGDYFATYIERDLRELMQLRNLSAFETFVRLAAGRTGQLLNLHSLAADSGISSQTARAWMSVLEASFIVFLLPPWFANIGKRLTKSPKLYFCDVGLAAWLIGIRDETHLASHPLRGNLFENLVVLEVVKRQKNLGRHSRLFFYRDSNGREVDLLFEDGEKIGLAEIKSGMTVAKEAFTSLHAVHNTLGERVQTLSLIYGGTEHQRRSDVDVIGYQSASRLVDEHG
ncbi:ATP-binding protein [Pelodictyon luteolum]|uniref:ATPase (AAA+ superfamily)-like protein n=1 Tax=Chlorobium luteolum (strain DSM 273 / BCRC 81028 / 2530) TaxID=319225 RepID=Q3B1L8_CHLL3|nr:ATPase (AAA+ superfamily)-like protein [Pelodictyon luteolum DSM 273]